MSVKFGKEIYNTDHETVAARGIEVDATLLTKMLHGPVKNIIYDKMGKKDVRELLNGVATTGFEKEKLQQILTPQIEVTHTRIGEALCETFVANEHNCEFPWPASRDLKNPNASPAGADLVGFQHVADNDVPYRFAFGEVKTSTESKWPPTVSHREGGLQDQINDLRDSEKKKENIILYLYHHAKNATWMPMFQSAVKRYLRSISDVTIFGGLVRDVEPKETDLSKHAVISAKDKPTETNITFVAIYLPIGIIPKLPKMLSGGLSA